MEDDRYIGNQANDKGKNGALEFPMMVPIQRFIESLRNELQQYGEMLALLEQQHQAVLFQGADDVLHCLSNIQTQGALIEKARQIRKEAVQSLNRAYQLSEDVTLTTLIPLLPEHFRPLVMALVQENNALIRQIRQRAQRNHRLLQRSVDLMQLFINRISPDDDSLTSAENHPSTTLSSGSNLYEAIA